MLEKFEKISAGVLAVMALVAIVWVFAIQPSGPAQPELPSTILTLIFGAVIPVLLIALIVKKQRGFKASIVMAALFILLGLATVGRALEISQHPFAQTTLIVGIIAVLLGLFLIFAVKKALDEIKANPFEEAKKVASG